MKMKKYLILAIVSFSILIVLWPSQQITGETGQSAKDKENDSNLTALHKSALSAKLVWANRKEVLQGLEGVHVLVNPIEPGVEEYGLTEKALQTDTELQLRQYGIKVLTKEECGSTPGTPFLYIEAKVIMREEVPVAAASIVVQLRENVPLLRKPARFCIGASTWQRGVAVLVGLDEIKDLKGYVKDFVDEFINDYLAANPKESPVKEEEEKPKDD